MTGERRLLPPEAGTERRPLAEALVVLDPELELVAAPEELVV